MGNNSPQKIPERIGRLNELANNLWWSWYPQARDLFRALDYPLWVNSGHNPVKMLREISDEKLQAAASDITFLTHYDSVMAAFDAVLSTCDTWFATNYPRGLPGPVAYFCMEFAIHGSLPIYSGGLGLLAGDICKEASDLGLPFVGVGLMYPKGYFYQHISSDGWQQEIYEEIDFDSAPINQVFGHDGEMVLVEVPLDDRIVQVGAWLVRLGCANLYLLDTNIATNAPEDRQISSSLYTSDRELRLKQEIVLGIGGVRMLRKLGIDPFVWHANESHTSFMMLERAAEEIEKGAPFNEAIRRVAATTIFTTHTPLPAGHEVFPVQFVDRYLGSYMESLGIDKEIFLKMGRLEGTEEQTFSMTVLALRMAEQRNGVSQLHGKVARRMWHPLWPSLPEEKVPIIHVTNGVHVPTWIAPEINRLYRKYLGPDWIRKHDDPALWEQVLNIPDEELWAIHFLLKRKLIHNILERAQNEWAEGRVTSQHVLAIGALLDHDMLTIGFCRRFTDYKRPALIFRDVERLKRIIKDRWQPVQIIFAGKSHPADTPAKHLLQHVFRLATDREFQGRIAFVEDYDMHIAHYLVQGVDVWLNNPRRQHEASGTSGMKASLNGVPNLSILDGWWLEGYNGKNGWAIGDSRGVPDWGNEDEADAEALYRLLEEQVVPLYYDRDRSGVPHGWVRVAKEAIRSVAPTFSARRMAKEYIERMYLAAGRQFQPIP